MSRYCGARRKYPDQSGFTLIELMIVVAIIGVLAAIAIPRYLNNAAQARQAEAVSVLSAVYTLQITHKADTGRFGASEVEIGLDVPGKRTYNPVVFSNVSSTAFTATISANLDNDPTIDTWQLTQTNTKPTVICDDVTDAGPAC